MQTENIAELVRGLFAAYRALDREFAERLLSPDFTFTSPYDDHIDRATYFERCWPDHEWIRALRIEALVTEGDRGFVLYEIEPIKGETFRNTEFFRFENGLLRMIEVYFGALPKGGPGA
jgi:hypothetical protein